MSSSWNKFESDEESDEESDSLSREDHDRLIGERDDLIRDLLNQIKTKTIQNIEMAKMVGDMAIKNHQNLLEAHGHIEMVDRVLSLRIKALEGRLKGNLL